MIAIGADHGGVNLKLAIQNYFDENGLPNSLETLSSFTGISQRNVNRLINENKELSNLYGKNLKL